jgi:hypothetical protein
MRPPGSGRPRAGRLAVAARAVFLGLLLTPMGAAQALAQTWTQAQLSRQIQEHGPHAVEVHYPAGRFTLTGADSPLLYTLRARYDADAFRPVQSWVEGRLVLGVEGTGRRVNPFRGHTEAELAVTLSRRVPLDLTLELGAVEADIELGGLRLRTLDLATGASDGTLRVSEPNPEPMSSARIRVGASSFRGIGLGHLNAAEFDVNAGVGSVRLDFSGLRREETTVRVGMGVGSLEIQVPSDVGVRLIRRSFLVSLSAPGLQRSGDELYSSNWQEAPVRLVLELNAALGSISVTRIEP